jgi:hypothetical protein
VYNQFPTSFGQQQIQSQYRGVQRQFQPTGAVQSFYKSNPAQGGFYGSAIPQTQSYHASNYVGNQPGHDASQRADSQSPSFSAASRGMGTQFTAMSGARQVFQPSSPSSYHMQSYVGNQPNHDLQLRADSVRPSMGMGGMSYQASTTPSSYHMQSYVGNQPNHDLQLRADSFRPSNGGWR